MPGQRLLLALEVVVLSALVMIVLVSSEPSPACLAAAHRFTNFLIDESKGTRHEDQIRAKLDQAGGLDKAVRELAVTFHENQCAFILAAPDSTVRALAIAALPERSGK